MGGEREKKVEEDGWIRYRVKVLSLSISLIQLLRIKIRYDILPTDYD